MIADSQGRSYFAEGLLLQPWERGHNARAGMMEDEAIAAYGAGLFGGAVVVVVLLGLSFSTASVSVLWIVVVITNTSAGSPRLA